MVFIQILFQVLVPVCLVIVFQESTLEFYVFFYCSRNAEIEEIAVLLLALSVSANYLKSICIEFVATTLGKC